MIDKDCRTAAYLYGLGGVLLVSRLTHYLTLNISPLALTRPLSMLGTFTALLMGSGWLLVYYWGYLHGL